MRRLSWCDSTRPVLRNENKQVLFAIACPAGAVHSGRLEYSRWPEIPLPLPLELDPGA